MERSTARVEDSADRRTELAADRTIFAAERTYAAWVRTGVCTENLNPHVMLMKSTKDRV